jgi:seryl-tRNA synthetase
LELKLTFERPIHEELVPEIEKGAAYACAKMTRFRVTPDRSGAEIACEDDARDEVTEKVRRYVDAMMRSFRSLGEPEELLRRDSDRPLTESWGELLSRKWARPLGRGHVALAGGAYALKRYLDDAVRDAARARFGAADEDHPELLDPEVLARCGYLGSFPHSVSLVSHLREDFDAIEAFRAANSDRSPALETAAVTTDAVLRPAICLPVYRELEGETMPKGGLAITTSGRAFRYESRNMEGLRRLWDFSMREIVFVSSAQEIEARRTALVDLVKALMESWDLSFRLVSATDPFFATVRGTKALFQRTRALKYEALVDTKGGPLAAGSINFAGTLFGDAFGIKSSEGDVAATACVGFGLERLVLALFDQHGFDAAKWPRALREVVFG